MSMHQLTLAPSVHALGDAIPARPANTELASDFDGDLRPLPSHHERLSALLSQYPNRGDSNLARAIADEIDRILAHPDLRLSWQERTLWRALQQRWAFAAWVSASSSE